jgi:hypothetical protein
MVSASLAASTEQLLYTLVPTGLASYGEMMGRLRRRNDFTRSTRRSFSPTMVRANTSLAGLPSWLFPVEYGSPSLLSLVLSIRVLLEILVETTA